MKLTKEDKQVIVASVKLNNSKQNIEHLCKEYNITRQYVYKLAKKDICNDIKQNTNEDKQMFTKKANHIIELLFDRIEKELKENDKVSLSQLSTTLGILYDKSRLENNLSTNNSSININIKVEK